MRKSWVLLSGIVLSLSSACGKIKSEKPTNIRDVSVEVDAAFKEEAERRLKELDARILELQTKLTTETGNREALENELQQALFLKSWESIRSIQPCGTRFPNLTLNLGKRVAYPFTTVLRLKSPGDGNVPAGPLDPGEYFFAGHTECPFRVELANEPIDIIGQTALKITSGEVQVQRVCWIDKDLPLATNPLDANVCSTVLGDRKL